MDDRYIIETPEIVAVAYDLAGIGSRGLAAVVDTLLLLLLQLALGLALLISSAFLFGDSASSLALALWALASFTLLWGYYLLFELIWAGQSPAKRLLGLRVVREGGRPLTFAASAVRNLLRIVDFLPALYGLGVLVMFADPRSRRLGDLAAGTLVVRAGPAPTLASLAHGATAVALPPRDPEAPPTPLLPNLHLVGPVEYELAQDFMRRRALLDQARRAALAADLAAALRARLALTPTGDPERFIEHFIREYRVQQQGTTDQ